MTDNQQEQWYVREEATGNLHGSYSSLDTACNAAQLMSGDDLSQDYVVYTWQELVIEEFSSDEEAARDAVWESLRERVGGNE